METTHCSYFLVSLFLQSPLIVRMDLNPPGGILFFDVEKLSLKHGPYEKKHKQVASIVAVVNEQKDLVFWAFVCWEPNQICQMFPQITGVDQSKLKNGLCIEEVTTMRNITC